MLNYQGSKSKIGKWIKEFIPKSIKTYIEPFGGMFKVYYNMDLKIYSDLNSIVYSDYNNVNSNIFKCVQTDHNRLKEIVETIPYPTIDYCRRGETSNWIYHSLFYEYQRDIFNKSYNLSKPDFHAGAQYSFVCSHSYNGNNPKKSKFTDPKFEYESKFPAFINKLNNPWYHDHFQRITEVENLDFRKCFKKYDSEDAFYYIDPPYKGKEHYYSNHNFFIKTHKILSERIKKLKGKWILSYYFFDELLEWLPTDRYHWYSKDFLRPSAHQSGAIGKEIIILNYEPESIPIGTNCISNDTNHLDLAA